MRGSIGIEPRKGTPIPSASARPPPELKMGVISPPVGVNVYVVSGMDRAVPLQSVFKGALPFLAALVVAALLLLAFPQIVTVPTSWVK